MSVKIYGYVRCLRPDQAVCTHLNCQMEEEDRIEALPNPSLVPVLEVTEVRENRAGQREYRRVSYSAWRVVPEP